MRGLGRLVCDPFFGCWEHTEPGAPRSVAVPDADEPLPARSSGVVYTAISVRTLQQGLTAVYNSHMVPGTIAPRIDGAWGPNTHTAFARYVQLVRGVLTSAERSEQLERLSLTSFTTGERTVSIVRGAALELERQAGFYRTGGASSTSTSTSTSTGGTRERVAQQTGTPDPTAVVNAARSAASAVISGGHGTAVLPSATYRSTRSSAGPMLIVGGLALAAAVGIYFVVR